MYLYQHNMIKLVLAFFKSFVISLLITYQLLALIYVPLIVDILYVFILRNKIIVSSLLN